MSSFPIFLMGRGCARGGRGWVSTQPEFIHKSELHEITHNGPGYRLFIHTNTLANTLVNMYISRQLILMRLIVFKILYLVKFSLLHYNF